MSQPVAGVTYDITLDPEAEGGGVDRISFVKSPAIRRGFIALAEVVPEVGKLIVQLKAKETAKRIVTGPVLIPEQEILRLNDKNEPYHIRFSEGIIETISRKFMREQRTKATNQEHDPKTNANDHYLFESWLIVDPTRDKSIALGMEPLPKGTWMASYKVEDEELWKRIENGEILGFSLEGEFEYAALLSTQPPNPEKQAAPATIKPKTTMAKARTTRRNRMHSAWAKMKGMKPFLSVIPQFKAAYEDMKEFMAEHVLETGENIWVDDETLEVWIMDAEGNVTTETLPDGTYTLGGRDAGLVLEVMGGKSTKAIAEIEAADSTPAAQNVEQSKAAPTAAEAALLARIAALEARLPVAEQPVETPAPNPQADVVARLERELAAAKAHNEKLAALPAVGPLEKEKDTSTGKPNKVLLKESPAEYYVALAEMLEKSH